MSRVMTSFIDALRAADVRVSTAETLDAMRAAELVGFADRALLKDVLSVSLAKTPEEKESFDEAFDRFFSFESLDRAMRHGGGAHSGGVEGDAPEADARGQQAQNEQVPGEGGESGEDAAAQSEASGAPGMPGAPSGGGMGQPAAQAQDAQAADALDGDDADAPQRRALMEILRSGDRTALAMEIARAGEAVGIRNIRFFTQRGLYGRRIMEEIGLEELNAEIRAAERAEGPEGPGLRALQALREELRRDVDDFVERNLQLHAQNEGRRLREEVLERVRLTNVEMRDMRIMRELVRKMSKRLVALHSRRRKRARRGHLDVRRTLRHNVAFDGLLFDTHWKRRKVDRPEVMAICDVSGSVATVARFLLMFLYSLDEVLPKVRSFAFSGHLGEVTDLFREMDIEDAIPRIMHEWGGGSTDYGVALREFAELALDDIDRHTTVILLGDARSNHVDPGAEILQDIYKRARRVLILNPEPETLWGTGDSEMLRLKPFCQRAEVCGSLRDLERVVDDILRTAA